MTQSRSTCAVICGLPGDLQHVGDLKDHKIAKVGGQPVFPGSIPPSDIVISCCTCGNRMALAVQVHDDLKVMFIVCLHSNRTACKLKAH